LADVHAPHRDHYTDFHSLWLPPDQSCQLDSLHDGRCRHCVARKSIFISNNFPANNILKVAKCLKYLGYTTITDYLFGLFIVVWFAARHVTYLAICWSVYADIPREIRYGCYKGRNGAIEGPFPAPDKFGHLIDPFVNPEGVVCWNDKIKWGFLSALLFLQGITLMWFWMIIKVAIRVLRGGEADDIRSDDEGDNDESVHKNVDEQLPQAELPPYEEEVGVEAINLRGRTSNATKNRYRKGTSSATGVSIPGHSDRKELLGRIGCDKGV
jgi:acyl-CoA-dependent ceramide synthase